MPTIQKFYLHDAASDDPGTLPSGTNVSAQTPTSTPFTVANKKMHDVIGATQASIAAATQANTNLQRIKIGRWLSAPLAAQTIASGTWSWRLAGAETNAASNMFFSICIAIWRPSTGAIVGRFFDHPQSGLTDGLELGTT